MKVLKLFISLILCFTLTALTTGCGDGTPKDYNPSPILLAKNGKVYLIGIADNFDIVDPRIYFDKFGYDFNITSNFQFIGNENQTFNRSFSDISFDIPEIFDLEATVDHFQWLYDDETPTVTDGPNLTDNYVGVSGPWKKIPRKTTFIDDREILSDLDNDGKKDTLTLTVNSDNPNRIDINVSSGDTKYASRELFETPPTDTKIIAVADLNGDGWMEIIMTFKTDTVDVLTIYTMKFAGKVGFVRQARFEYFKEN